MVLQHFCHKVLRARFDNPSYHMVLPIVNVYNLRFGYV